MRRGTTPTHTFTLPIDTSVVKSVRITYRQNRKVVLTKETEDVAMEGNQISVKLTQEETLAFDGSTGAEIQVRVLSFSKDALASDVMRVSISDILDDEVLA